MTAAALSVSGLAGAGRRRTINFAAFATGLGVAAGLVAASLALSGHAVAIVGLTAVLLPLVLWRTPQAGVAVLILAAALIEQFPVPYPQFGGVGTDEIFYFTSLNEGIGVAGVLITPLELTIAALLVVWLTRAAAYRTLRLPRSHLGIGFAILFVIILFAAARGLATGADLRLVLRELRPWVYVFVLYVLASQILARRGVHRPLLWAFVIGTAIKGAQGSARFLLVVTVNPRPAYILSHEDAVFFSLYILLTAALWIFGERGWLRRLATAMLPVVLFANLANGRRTSWLILVAGTVALLVIAWIRLPQRRGLLRSTALVLAGGALLYFPLFWQSTALWGEPARAIRSAVAPAPGEAEAQSNLYRHFENANLMSDIRRTTPMGQGFGVPIDYSTFPGHDAADLNPAIRFTPHDGILYVWMVAGIPGALAFWFVLGAAFVAASRLARAQDRQMALFGAFTVCALIAYLLEAYYDFGLSWFRVAVLMGCLLGALEAAYRLSTTAAAVRASARAA